MDELHYGKILFFLRKSGYGFLHEMDLNDQDVPGNDIFFHFSALNKLGYKDISWGVKVSYNLGTNIKGQVVAVNITELDSNNQPVK